MATKVYSVKDISLQDDTEVTLRPLAIGRLRRFMEAWDEFKDSETEADTLRVFVNCAGIALEKSFEDKFDTLEANADQKKKGEYLSPDYKQYLEEVLDMETIYEIMEVCGGMKLNDPNLLAAVAEAAGQS